MNLTAKPSGIIIGGFFLAATAAITGGNKTHAAEAMGVARDNVLPLDVE